MPFLAYICPFLSMSHNIYCATWSLVSLSGHNSYSIGRGFKGGTPPFLVAEMTFFGGGYLADQFLGVSIIICYTDFVLETMV